MGWKNEEKETRFQMGKFARGINYPFPLLFNKAERNSATRRAKVVSLSKNISSSLAFFNTEGSVSEITVMRKQSLAVFQPYIPAKPHSRTWREKRRQGDRCPVSLFPTPPIFFWTKKRDAHFSFSISLPEILRSLYVHIEVSSCFERAVLRHQRR